MPGGGLIPSALPGTAGRATWVTFGVLWWRKGLAERAGPPPSVALPVSVAVSSAVILYASLTARPPAGGRVVTSPVLGEQPVDAT